MQKLKSMKDLLHGIQHDLRSAINQATAPHRNYQRKSQFEFENPKYARFKAVIWYKNGKCRWYYSFDQCKFEGSTFIDEHISLKKLIKMILEKKNEYKNAIIYATPDEIPTTDKAQYNYEVVRWDYYGNIAEDDRVRFNRIDGSLKMDLIHLKMKGTKINNKKTEK